jgi:hypothetical protein
LGFTRQITPKCGSCLVKSFITIIVVITRGCWIVMAFSYRNDLYGWKQLTSSLRYIGAWPWRALKVYDNNLHWKRYCTGSQWRDMITDVMWYVSCHGLSI